MRLMFVITRGDSAGGAQMHVLDMARRLVADGHDVHVVVGATGTLTDELATIGVSYASCPGLLREVDPLQDFRAVRQLKSMIQAYGPDLVTTHSSKAGIVGRLAARWAGVPCLFTVHGWAFIDTVRQPVRSIYRWMERGSAHLAERIICVSDQVHGMGVAAGIDPAKMVVVHNGMPEVAPTLRADPAGKEPRAIMVARFAAPKDHATLIRAMALVPDLRLDFVGDGPDEEAARALARELGLTNRITFLGRRNDVAELLARAHIFVLSSLSEGFPCSTLEAMRAGLPVIVSDAGGAGEAVVEGETGFVVPRADVQALAGRLAALAADADLRARMGAEGRRLYEAEFSFERMYRKTLAVYEGILASARAAAPALGAS